MECCVCFNETLNTTPHCRHCLCEDCIKKIVGHSSHYTCPYCRRQNVFVDNKFIEVFNKRKINIEYFTKYLFEKQFRNHMERLVEKKYFNFFSIFKYTNLILFDNKYFFVKDLDKDSLEYIFYCEMIDLPIKREKKEFFIQIFKELNYLQS